MKAFKSLQLFFTMVFVAVLSLSLGQPVYAWTIIDDPTGGDCNTIGRWNANKKTCTLKTDVSEGIVIDSDNITLLCNRHSITNVAWSWFGIYVTGRNGVTINKCIVSKFEYGIWISASGGTTLNKNIVSGYGAGIYISSSTNSYLNANAVDDNERIGGIIIDASNNSYLNGNTVNNNGFSGIAIFSSTGSFLDDNTVNNNASYGIGFFSATDSYLDDNTANNNASYGIGFFSSTYCYLDGNTANNNLDGIVIGVSTNARLNDNTADNNLNYGYHVGEIDNTFSFGDNECSDNGMGGSFPTGLCSP